MVGKKGFEYSDSVEEVRVLPRSLFLLPVLPSPILQGWEINSCASFSRPHGDCRPVDSQEPPGLFPQGLTPTGTFDISLPTLQRPLLPP